MLTPSPNGARWPEPQPLAIPGRFKHPARRAAPPARRPRTTAPPPRPRRGPHPVAKDTGLTNLPLHDLDQNQIWCALVALACELTAWAQLLALTEHPARRWEPKRLRLRLLSIAGRLARTGRRTVLHLAAHAPWAPLLLQAITSLRALPAPGRHPAHPVPTTHRSPGPWNRRPPERPRAIVIPADQNQPTQTRTARSRSSGTPARKIWARATCSLDRTRGCWFQRAGEVLCVANPIHSPPLQNSNTSRQPAGFESTVRTRGWGAIRRGGTQPTGHRPSTWPRS